MAKTSEQFRQSDVTIWGAVALVAGAVAVLSANISALLPQSVLASLHQARLQGATLEQLRFQVSDLRDQSMQLQRNNDGLTARFLLEEQQGDAMQQRVGALEVSLPKLLEALPDTAEIDRTNLTASIGDDNVVSFEADGGSVEVRQRPMIEPPAPLPALPDPVTTGSVNNAVTPVYGIALGPNVSEEQALSAWQDISTKVGPLLLGLEPLLSAETDGGTRHIVAGPVTQLSEATALCQRLERIAIACLPMPFNGTPLDQ